MANEVVQKSKAQNEMCYLLMKVNDMAVMNKKILTVILSFGLVVVIGGYLACRSVPPYYYQSKLFFMLNEDNLQALADKFKKNEHVELIELAGSDSVKAVFSNYKQEQRLNEDQSADYAKLLSEAHVSFARKIKNGTLFYIGADYKFEKSFQIAYVLLDKVSGDEPVCDSIQDKVRGICFIFLDENWSINYEWVGAN